MVITSSEIPSFKPAADISSSYTNTRRKTFYLPLERKLGNTSANDSRHISREGKNTPKKDGVLSLPFSDHLQMPG